MHAADVAQTISVIMSKSNMIEILHLQEIDVLSFIFSAIIHDFKHPGQTNAYHVNMQSDLALLYNDSSVLENMHIAEAFKALNKTNCDIFENLSKEEKKIVRKRIIDMVLATDMSLHTKLYTNLKLKVENFKIEKEEAVTKLIKDLEGSFSIFDFQQDVFNYTLHAADLSHNVKSFDITEKWTYLLMNEFWNQGDLEKMNNLPISFNCDRHTANVPKSQIGFLNGFILPTFMLLTCLFPQVNYLVDNAKSNIDKWNEIMSKENKNN